jgi:hypothetical protein
MSHRLMTWPCATHVRKLSWPPLLHCSRGIHRVHISASAHVHLVAAREMKYNIHGDATVLVTDGQRLPTTSMRES